MDDKMNAQNPIHPRLSSRDVTLHVLKSFGLHATKRFGQNFLIAPHIVQEIVDAADLHAGEPVLEIGPGIGTLTQALAETGASVTALEIDKKLPSVLAETLAGYRNVRVVLGDILKTDVRALMQTESFKVVANLPYYITTPILMRLLEQHLPIERMVTMVQKEVAERMVAAPNAKAYGALSLAVQYYTEPRLVCTVPPRSFFPAPEVDSVVIACKVREKPAVTVDERIFFRVVRAAFGQRRKTLTNALAGGGFPKDNIRAALLAANIDPTRRGETLSMEEFAALARALTEK